LQIEINNTDIFSVSVDAIVNPANKQAHLWLGSHINEVVRKKGGKQIVNERKEKGEIKLGEAVSTCAGNLPCQYVIHTAILDMYDFNSLFLLKIKQRTSDNVLRNATISSLQIADKLKIKSIAYSPMGTGIGAMKMEKCVNIMLQEIINFQTTYNNDILKKIIFCVRGEKDYLIAMKVLKRLRLPHRNKQAFLGFYGYFYKPLF